MNYYYINTEKKHLNYSPHEQWIDRGYAFTSGDYEEYGRQALGTLDPDDILFMYVNECGVVAAGRVCEYWDDCAYAGEDRWIYQDMDILYTEYRIRVDWTEAHPPINRKQLIEIVGWTSIKALQRITDIDAARRLLAEVMRRNGTTAAERR